MKLSEPQASLLRTCRDGQPHSTGPATGGVASALERRGLVTCSYRLGTSVTITDLGREVLAALEGAGRQTSIPAARRPPTKAATCPVCHRPGRLRAPPATPTLHAHRDSDAKLCDGSGETIESAKAIAIEKRIARRLRMGDEADAIATSENVTPGYVAAVQTKINEGRR